MAYKHACPNCRYNNKRGKSPELERVGVGGGRGGGLYQNSSDTVDGAHPIPNRGRQCFEEIMGELVS